MSTHVPSVRQLALIGGLLAIVLGAPAARAYPYFQLTSGTDTCGACHVSPTGGGALSEWGRGEAGDTLARGGDGRFLHGKLELPPWIDVTGDVRVAALVNDVGNPNGAEVAAFPMQAELGVHAGGSGAWHLVASAGVLGSVRGAPADATGGVVPGDAPALPWLVSREHYVMWRPADQGPYVRAGKFPTPYGLRLADHTTYVRRRLGLALYEEPYGVSGGFLGERWDVHVTGFVSDPWRGPPDRELGGALMVERRAGPAVAGLSARFVDGADDRRGRLGLSGGWWREAWSLYAMAELDGGWESLPGRTRAQLTGYAGLAWLPVRGLTIGAAYQHDDVDLGAADDSRRAIDLWSSFLPIAHVELALSTRYQWIAPDARAAMAMFQLHYFL